MLEISYPNWYLLLCLLLGAGLAILLYFRDQRNGFSTTVAVSLGILRGLVVATLCMLLLEPLIKYTSYQSEEPLLLIGVDNSQSMRNHVDSLTLAQSIETFVQQTRERLDGKFQVKPFTFGEVITPFDTLSFQEAGTNISDFLEELNALYSFQNVAGIVVVSDGIYNQGSNPEYVRNRIDAPLYVLETGDTSQASDIRISNSRFNEIAFLGDRFPLEFDALAEGLKGQRTRVTLSGYGTTLAQETWDLQSEHDFRTFYFEVEAKKEGIQRFTLTVEALENERTRVNNQMSIYVKVLNARQKILMLYSFPHPDVAAIRRTLENNENYEVELLHVDKLPEMDLTNLDKNYNLAVLYQVPESRGPLQYIQALMDNPLPKMIVVGSRTNLAYLNQQNIGVKVAGFNGQFGTVKAALNGDFTLFDLQPKEKSIFQSLPPLTVPFGEAKAAGNFETLVRQQIGLVKTEYPMWSFSEINGQKYGVLLGEGIWRWPLAEFGQHGSSEVFNKIWDRSAAYLASKDLNRPFRVRSKRSFKESEPVVFYGELYNPAFERINDPEATVVVTDPDGGEYSWQMARNNGKYLLEAGVLPPGKYAYRARVSYGGKELKDQGEFTVSATYLEFVEHRTNHQMLTNLAQSSGGQLYRFEEGENWLNQLASQPAESVVYEEHTYLDLIHLKWIFACLLVLLSVEWFFRKREGVI